jgi:hypothetical protein
MTLPADHTPAGERLAVQPSGEPMIVTCPACEGDGGWEIAETGSYGYRYDSRDGGLITHWTRCGECEGKGEVEIEPEIRTLEDVERDYDEDRLEAFAYRGGNL